MFGGNKAEKLQNNYKNEKKTQIKEAAEIQRLKKLQMKEIVLTDDSDDLENYEIQQQRSKDIKKRRREREQSGSTKGRKIINYAEIFIESSPSKCSTVYKTKLRPPALIVIDK